MAGDRCPLPGRRHTSTISSASATMPSRAANDPMSTETGMSDQVSVVEGQYEPIEHVRRSHLKSASLFEADQVFATRIIPYSEALLPSFTTSRATPIRRQIGGSGFSSRTALTTDDRLDVCGRRNHGVRLCLRYVLTGLGLGLFDDRRKCRACVGLI